MNPTLEEVTAKLTNESALSYLKGYTVEREDLFPEMLDSLLRAQSKEQFDNFVILYLLNEEYPRADISLVCSTVSREKGWSV
jgi:hypothetical protein